MSKVSVFDHAWIDLVFEGRNKEYGAYQLRKQDSKTTLIALFSGIALMGLLISIPVLINYFKPVEPEVVITELKLPEAFKFDNKIIPEPPKPEPIVPQEQAAEPQSATPIIDFRQPVVTATTAPVELPTMDDFVNADPGSETNPGNEQGGIVIGPSGTGDENSTGNATEGDGTENEIVDRIRVDVSPEFPGGMDRFNKKIGEGFDIPDVQRAVTLRVFVSFVVEKDGSMSNIKVIKDPGYGMGNEAIRVLKSIKTKWKPGIKDGKPVRTAFNLPIVLNVK